MKLYFISSFLLATILKSIIANDFFHDQQKDIIIYKGSIYRRESINIMDSLRYLPQTGNETEELPEGEMWMFIIIVICNI
jgi:hypothetical protein